MEMQWYTAYTKPNCEKKVTALLNRKNIMHFCPIDVISNQAGKKVNESFCCYVFIKVAETQVKQISQLQGIKHLLYWMDKPAIVSESEIDLIKSFLTEHSYVKLEKRDAVSNTSVFNNVPQKENQAKLIHLSDNKIKAALPSLRSIMIAEFEKIAAQAISNDTSVAQLRPKFKYRIAGNN